MKYFDFITQSVLLLGTMIIAIPLGVTGVLIGAFVVGSWQMVSSVLSFLFKTPFRKYKTIHLALSTVYLAVFVTFSKPLFATENATAFLIAMMVACILAIFYYIITYSWAFSESKRSKFLPNVSF
jgi:hypothetical protein